MLSRPYSYYDAARRAPHLPLEGALDLTYRCNFSCRHCWIRNAASATATDELSVPEIARIAAEAKQLGCRQWTISGGEPLLRPDFEEVFACLARLASAYTLNTNGSLITPAIAKLLTRRGYKLIALYGADAQTQDHITRTPGSFEALLRGCAYMREAGAGFTVQIIPMHDNAHQLDEMISLAQSLSPRWRIGAAWLYLRADRNALLNREILRQRLPAEMVNRIDPAIPDCGAQCASAVPDDPSAPDPAEKRIFWGCIMESRQFHIDPYGNMSFCSAIQAPGMRFDLRRFSFQEIWEKLIPRLAEAEPANPEYLENCAVCSLRRWCHWCGAYAWLESGRVSAPVPYLCKVARARKQHDDDWRQNHRRYFSLAGLTIQVDSDLPFSADSFDARFDTFVTEHPGDDLIAIYHHYSLPDPSEYSDAERVYDKKPWEIYRKEQTWVYMGVGRSTKKRDIRTIAVFNETHTRAQIFHRNDHLLRHATWGSLTALPSDHILLAPVLARRQAVVFHSAGLVLNGHGLLFVGHSGAGKSTIVKLLRSYGIVLCDDRVIVRRWPDGFHIHGTWSRGEIDQVANDQAPLRAILILKKSRKNALVPLEKPAEIVQRLLLRVTRPLVTIDWLDKTLPILAALANQVPVYQLSFTRDNRILPVIEKLTGPLTKPENGQKNRPLPSPTAENDTHND